MATATAISGQAVKSKGGITVLQGGNVDSARVSENVTLISSLTEAQNGTVYISANSGNSKAYSGRVVGKVEASNFVILTQPFNIAGVADTTLSKSSTFGSKELNAKESEKITSLTDLAWDASGNELPVYTFTRTSTTVSMGTDRAAHVSTSRRITYTTGKPNPISEAF